MAVYLYYVGSGLSSKRNLKTLVFQRMFFFPIWFLNLYIVLTFISAF